MSWKAIAALVVALLLQFSACLWLYKSLQATRQELSSTSALVESQKASLDLLRGQVARIQTNTAKVTKANQEHDRVLQSIIEGLPDRGSRSTPATVVDGLCKRLRCVQRDAGGNPVQSPSG